MKNGSVSPEKKKVAPVAWMIIIGDGLHNFIDGLAIGASFSSSTYVGISTALAIFCEELPHELGNKNLFISSNLSGTWKEFVFSIRGCRTLQIHVNHCCNPHLIE